MPDETRLKYQDPELPVADRAADLVSRMTLEEKVSQMLHESPAIERLGIAEYNWWTECLHGAGRAGAATVFPQAIGMAASFNPRLLGRVAAAISDEVRAKHHQAARQGNRGQYFGLTCWSPNVNIFRDPRWGRGQETYGEDPYLTARMGVVFVRGLQGEDPKYLKVVATPKHYAVHSGPEAERHSFDAAVGRRDLHETYLPAFKACVQEGKAASIMGAYNRVNGEPCCASKTLLGEILRGQWGFDGYVVSDCWAICDLHKNHKVTRTPPASAAMAVRNGCDLNCGSLYPSLLAAVKVGLITEGEIDVALRRLMVARMRLGMFDSPQQVRYAQFPPHMVLCAAHRRLARQMARESIVLLKNADDLLPLNKDIKSVAVIGPAAYEPTILHGNYFGFSPRMVTPLEGIVGAVSPGTQVTYVKGCDLAGDSPLDTKRLEWVLTGAEVIIAVMGYSPELEGEQNATIDPQSIGDRLDINLPGRQEELLKRLHASGKPIVLVLTGGSAIAINWADRNIPAILMAWYPGQAAGIALADVLFGEYNPAGRLPVTFVKSLDQVPPFENYSMKGRTYRFMENEPLYPFGYGLSYTSFGYSNLRLSKDRIGPGESIRVKVDVENTGRRAGDEVVQLYVSDVEATVPVPIRHLEGFNRVHLQPGRKKTVTFTLKAEQLAAYDDEGRPFVEPGQFVVSVGGGQGVGRGAGAVVSETFTVC